MIEKVEWFELNGKKYPLVFTLGAMREAYRKYGDIKGLNKAMTTEATALDTGIEMILILNRQGCAYMNKFGQDLPYPDDVQIEDGIFQPIDPEELDLTLTFDDAPELLNKINSAFAKSQKTRIQGKSSKKRGAV